MTVRRASPYVWTTWLSKLLVGDQSCEWATWFKTNHQGFSWVFSFSISGIVSSSHGHSVDCPSRSLELRDASAFEEWRDAGRLVQGAGSKSESAEKGKDGRKTKKQGRARMRAHPC
jgi:hypothetical protein